MRYILLFASLSFGQMFYPQPPDLDTSRVLVPSDLEYQGAFRFPRDLAGSTHGFTYLEGAMTYSPSGDSAGPADGYPGALHVAGHAYERGVALIDIPAPSLSRTYSALPVARVLRPFRAFGVMPPYNGVHVMALEELGDRVYVSMSDGYRPSDRPEQQRVMSWGPLDLSSFLPMRRISPRREDCFGDYLFAIPPSWAARYAPGRTLVAGRHREGNLCGAGPALFAMSPLADTGDLTYTPMLMYRQATNANPEGSVVSYSFGGDLMKAGAWLESGRKSAVLLTGQKGLSRGTYGENCDNKGFFDAAGYRPYFMFYDPDTLGAVAAGRMASHQPQPYAGQDLTPHMLYPNMTTCANRHINALAYDRVRNLLYGSESHGEQPVVHVWRVKAYPAEETLPRDTVVPPPPPADTVPACRPDTVTKYEVIQVVDSTALKASQDIAAGLQRALEDVSLRLQAAEAARDSLAARPPDTAYILPRGFRLLAEP